jgi:peptide chain release factor 1
MIEKLEELKLRFEEVGQLLMQPETVKDIKNTRSSIEYKDLERLLENTINLTMHEITFSKLKRCCRKKRMKKCARWQKERLMNLT